MAPQCGLDLGTHITMSTFYLNSEGLLLMMVEFGAAKAEWGADANCPPLNEKALLL